MYEMPVMTPATQGTVAALIWDRRAKAVADFSWNTALDLFHRLEDQPADLPKFCSIPRAGAVLKEGHYIMIKGSIQEEDITIINIYAPNTGAPQYVRQMLKIAVLRKKTNIH